MTHISATETVKFDKICTQQIVIYRYGRYNKIYNHEYILFISLLRTEPYFLLAILNQP